MIHDMLISVFKDWTGQTSVEDSGQRSQISFGDSEDDHPAIRLPNIMTGLKLLNKFKPKLIYQSALGSPKAT